MPDGVVPPAYVAADLIRDGRRERAARRKPFVGRDPRDPDRSFSAIGTKEAVRRDGLMTAARCGDQAAVDALWAIYRVRISA